MPATSESAPAEVAQSAHASFVTDRAAWAEITARTGGSILQSWQWGEFKALHGWTPWRLSVERDGDTVLAAQVLSRRVGPFSVLYAPRGPMHRNPDPGDWAAFTLTMDRLAGAERSAIAFLEPDRMAESPPPAEGTLRWESSSVELQPLRTIKVRVDREDEEILAGMKNKTRYNVRLAGRRGVTVRRADLSEIAPFYELLEETSDRDAFGIHTIDYYADMLEAFGDSGALLLAECDGEIAAGSITLQHGEEAIYMFGASSRKHQRDMPTHLLQFEAMRWARERGCKTYDLWGIPPTDTPPDAAQDGDLNVRSGLWGVYRFKQGFGGDIVCYPGVFERVYYPRLVSLWRRFGPGIGG